MARDYFRGTYDCIASPDLQAAVSMTVSPECPLLVCSDHGT